jgi:hypothetical protein
MAGPNYDLVTAGMVLDELRGVVGRFEAVETNLRRVVDHTAIAAGLLVEDLRQAFGRLEAAETNLRHLVDRTAATEIRLADNARWLSLVEQRLMQIQTAQVRANLPPNTNFTSQ